jgi:lipid-A-disaccharide synthase
MLLLFNFEKKYFDKENILNTFVGHPLLEHNQKTKIDLSSLIDQDKKIISIFSGSRNSEVNILLPILCDFIKLMNKKSNDYIFFFHTTNENKNLISSFLKNNPLNNTQVISDENIKSQVLSSSIFAVAKSGTVSLEICNANIPSIIIYKINMINYLITRFLVKIKYVNIINIINNKEIIPELLQKECNSKEIYNTVSYFLKNPELMSDQVNLFNKTLNDIRSKSSSSTEASSILSKYLVS